MIKITLKDGTVKEYDAGISIYEIAKSISGRLAKEAVAGIVDGEKVDLSTKIEKDVELSIIGFDNEIGEDAFRHTSSHILAQAVLRLFPETKLAIGPPIKDGYYYDFDSEHVFTPEDLEKIEAEMKKIVKEKLPLERFELPRDEAIAYMKERNADYKVQLIEELPDEEKISFYKQGDFVDLCAGIHAPDTGKIKAVKLLSLAGAYWKGDEKNKMLQRIYGTSFPKASLLEAYLTRLEEAKKRDHRKLGKELELFALMDVGPGFPFFLPKGTILKNLLLDYWRQVHTRDGYIEIETPIMLNKKLWETSGHWYHYKENMYTLSIDEEEYAIKPMNCPGGMLVYNQSIKSYRDLPIRMGEIGRVHRHELSGALHGLMRVRAFTQDDAHIFMLPEQIKDEIMGVARLFDEVYKTFGFEYFVELSTKPEKSMGTKEEWDLAESALAGALDEMAIDYQVNAGDGAFYGPKIDFHLKDAIGRSWQCGTIQLDMQLPQRFDANYIGKDGEKHKPFVIHRVVYGSIERFIGILIEHFAGRFPVWIAPEQVKVIPVADRHFDMAKEIENKIKAAGLRISVDGRSEKVGYKIREAQVHQIPYMLVVGDKETESGDISVRSRDKGELGVMTIDDFVAKVKEEVASKTFNL
jgi:threonyl-tRNA synthetase